LKKLLPLLFICFIFNPEVSAQWIQQYVPNDAFLFGGINFENPNSGIVTGYKLGSSNTEFRSFRTTNGGINWNYVAAPDSFRVIAQFEYIAPQTAVGSGAYNLPETGEVFNRTDVKNNSKINESPIGRNGSTNTKGAFFKTTNGGANWTIIKTLPPPYTYATYIDFLNANTGMMLATLPYIMQKSHPTNILKTSDGGLSWSSLLPQNINGDIKAVNFVNENIAYVSGDEYYTEDSSKGVILKTTNGGLNWTKQLHDTLFIGKSYFINSTTGFVNAGGNQLAHVKDYSILKTTDGGNSWRKVYSSDSVFISGIEFFEESGVGIFYGTNNGFDIYECYALRTTDFGETWSMQLIYNSNIILLSATMLDRYNYYVTGGGFNGYIFHTINGGSVVINNNSGIIPEKFILAQNYPNPFNPSTTIKYNVPERSQIIIKVYNTNGKEIAELVKEIKSQGSYEVKFDASNLPSGIYYYKLISGDFSETKKMILIK
jgi:photosystem II stability/assembly factor-like uncharacterized protein